MDSERGLFIDGAWRRRGGAGESPVLDPVTRDSLKDAPMASADDTSDAIASAAQALPTRSPQRAREAGARIQSGTVGIDSFAPAAAEALFGGIEHSGKGRAGDSEGFADHRNTELGQVAIP